MPLQAISTKTVTEEAPGSRPLAAKMSARGQLRVLRRRRERREMREDIIMRKGEGKTKRKRERETERERERERGEERERDRERQRETERDRQRQREREREKERKKRKGKEQANEQNPKTHTQKTNPTSHLTLRSGPSPPVSPCSGCPFAQTMASEQESHTKCNSRGTPC